MRSAAPLLVPLVVAAAAPGLGPNPGHSPRSARDPAAETQALRSARMALARVPLAFEAYRDRSAPEVKFVARGPGYTTFFAPGEVVLALQGRGRAPGVHGEAVIRMQLDGASSTPRIEGLGSRRPASNYVLGQHQSGWQTKVSSFARLRYREVYPGIDLVFHGNQRRLEYDFVVAPGANPRAIAVRFKGAQKLRVDRSGDLIISVGKQVIRQPRPLLYQEAGPIRRKIPGRYQLEPGGVVGFAVGNYDTSKTLVIDPVLSYASYLGGDMADGALAVSVDSRGNFYVGGWTRSVNFPVESAVQPEYRGEDAFGYCEIRYKSVGCGDAFLTKINASGSKVIYSTYLGGTGTDSIRAIAVDEAGNAYVAGTTQSVDFPDKGGIPDVLTGGSIANMEKGFAAKIGPAGSVEYSTLLMGEGADGLALGPGGQMYVTGRGYAFDGMPRSFAFGGGREDPFVARLDPSATGTASLIYVTTFGGPGKDLAAAIAVDKQGAAYLTGSARHGLPAGQHAFQSDLAGASDAFVAKVSPDGSALEYATYLGGAGVDSGRGIAVDERGRAHVAGVTRSAGFPAKNGFKQSPAKKFKSDGFLAVLDPAGGKLVYSTYLGAADAEPHAVALDASGAVLIAGTAGRGLVLKRAVQNGPQGKTDAFLAKVNPSGSGAGSLEFSTYLGGPESDSARGVAVSPASGGPQRIYVAGFTGSPAGFPASAAALQPTSAGETDAFMAYFTDDTPGAAAKTRAKKSGRHPLVTGVEPTAGPTSGGSRVEIKGENLGRVRKVSFGGAAARIVENDNRRLVVHAPPHAEGLAPVFVTTAKGRSPSSAFATFQYSEGSWTSFRAPALMHHTATLLADGKVLAAGGCSKGSRQGTCHKHSRSSYLLDPVTHRWSFAGKMVAAGPHSAVRLRDGKVFVARADSAELYDPSTRRWKAAAAPGRNLDDASAVPPAIALLPDGKVLHIHAGRSSLYDPKADGWSVAGKRMPAGHANSTAILLKNGKVLTFGYIQPTELYDPKTDEWHPAHEPQKRRSYHTASLLPDGKVLIAGGRDEGLGPTSEAELYDPDALADPQKPEIKGAWSPARPMARPIYGHRAAVLADGSVLVVGGSRDYGDRLSNADIYDIKTGQWKPALKMAVARGSAVPSPLGQRTFPRIEGTGGTSFTATVLQDESVLVLGGSTAALRAKTTSALPSAEIYATKKTAGAAGEGIDGSPRGGWPGPVAWLLLASLALGAGGGALVFRHTRRRRGKITKAQQAP